MGETGPATAAAGKRVGSAWSPFRHRAFTVLWIATVVSNIGTWMYSAASGWLMATLSANPLVVSLVQVATSLPMLLFALPAGALADILDRRRLLILAETGTTVMSAALAALVWLGLITPGILLLLTFLIAIGSALTGPAWQSIVPELVPRRDLQSAIAMNGVGFNVSRAVGPALGGAIITGLGIAAPFWLNALSNFGVIGALFWWRAPNHRNDQLPAERFFNAIRQGVRHAVYNPRLRATLFRVIGFFLFASAYWALLPLVARSRISGGPGIYGILLGTIGAGAVLGAFGLSFVKARLGPDRMVATGTLGTAIALALYGLARDPAPALLASLVAGVSWILVLSSLNVSAQLALPEWVRGRGLSIFSTALFGAMTMGSMVWGELAAILGLPMALWLAAAGGVMAIPLTRRWNLQTGEKIDLTPSLNWPQPIASPEVEPDRGPVLVTVEYKIDPQNRTPFLTALQGLAGERRRDGAYAWGVYEDASEAGRILETFFVESWLEHQRQHARVTNADRVLQAQVQSFHAGDTPKVTHFVAIPRETSQKEPT